MYKKAQPFFMIVETPLHAGSGTDLGVVDLPIQREKHTDFPKIEGSSLKGSIREVFENLRTKDNKVDSPKLKAAFPSIEDAEEEKEPNGKIKYDTALNLSFGPEKGDEHAGALGFTDARLLFFPVKSMKGVFAWITCPSILERFKKDMLLTKNKINLYDIFSNKLISVCSEKECIVASTEKIVINGNVILEDYAFKINTSLISDCKSIAKWFSEHIFPNSDIYKYFKTKIETNIVILSDDNFRDFVNLSTEVITRIKINPETGTVASGQLFTEEYLPTESILYSLALTTPVFNKEKGLFQKLGKSEEDCVMEFFENGLPEIVQIGGNATIGKGLVRTNILKG